MKRRYQFGVLEEVAEAVEYLESRRPGLGVRFRASLERTLVFIEAFPEAAPVVYRRARRTIVGDFP